MPCSLEGQAYPSPGPPHACTTFPSWSNSTTDGAGLQHFTFGAVEARFSRASSVPGRWLIQMWSCASTKMPPIWPKIHWFGSVLGHDGSIWNFGLSAVSAGWTMASAMRPMSENVRTNLAIYASVPGPGTQQA